MKKVSLIFLVLVSTCGTHSFSLKRQKKKKLFQLRHRLKCSWFTNWAIHTVLAHTLTNIPNTLIYVTHIDISNTSTVKCKLTVIPSKFSCEIRLISRLHQEHSWVIFFHSMRNIAKWLHDLHAVMYSKLRDAKHKVHSL